VFVMGRHGSSQVLNDNCCLQPSTWSARSEAHRQASGILVDCMLIRRHEQSIERLLVEGSTCTGFSPRRPEHFLSRAGLMRYRPNIARAPSVRKIPSRADPPAFSRPSPPPAVGNEGALFAGLVVPDAGRSGRHSRHGWTLPGAAAR
jgi:hypothetical protein